MLNMFRTLMHPSSGACDFFIVSPHWLCFLVSMCVGVSVWLGWSGIRIAGWSTLACNTDTTPTQPHRNTNTHRTKNNTTNMVIQQNSRKLLMMDILMSETCWAHKTWNNIASDIKLVFYSSTIIKKIISFLYLLVVEKKSHRHIYVAFLNIIIISADSIVRCKVPGNFIKLISNTLHFGWAHLFISSLFNDYLCLIGFKI